MLHSIWKFIRDFFSRKPTIPVSNKSELERQYTFKMVEEHLPETLEVATLYVLTESGVPWEAAMMCPCGCGARLELNLLPDERPRWRYQLNRRGVPSLFPSINRKVGCRSHFFLRNGQIIWATTFDDAAGVGLSHNF